MNLISKCYLISLMSKLLSVMTSLSSWKIWSCNTIFSWPNTGYHSDGMISILFTSTLSFYLCWYFPNGRSLFQNYAFLCISPRTPPQSHNHSPWPRSEIQPRYYTYIPSRHTALQMLLANKNIEYNNENLHFPAQHTSHILVLKNPQCRKNQYKHHHK